MPTLTLTPLKILILEPNEILRTGLESIVSAFAGIRWVKNSPEDAEETIRKDPDIDLVITSLQSAPSPAMCSFIRAIHHPEARLKARLPQDPMTYLILIMLNERLDVPRPAEANPRFTNQISWIGSVRQKLTDDIQYLAQHGRMPWDLKNT